VVEVAPGILRAQLPIALPGLGHVNCYLLQDSRGVAVVDPGLPGPQS
jgi:glyoxylase-like metal-dependent hydrolase (beta-lactamase superfamily II)